MIRNLLARMIEGLFQPARSARWLLSADLGLDTALLFVALAYVLQAIIQIVLPGARPLPDGIGHVPLTLHMLNLLLQVFLVAFMSFMIFAIGRLFGGTGTRKRAFLIVSWHTLVTTVLSPPFLIGMASVALGKELSPPLLGLMVAAAAVWLWVLSVYTAVLHGFSNPWGVMGVILGVLFLLSALFMNMVPAP
ncbi:hypothetical protein H0I76_13505 [Limibaculum sp. M0105]|uniref:Yip1 domain-containing protein n=1 Tax=Thermohalobaculum xanthum TaxID=2753746 RepID=A0A8J7MA15_9RHOB|nr:hypothetical protein [Thermohalobaculum xanthum]MBK0400209.1 hypothetical protein [Thermohalobaculum xanthum]